jgi:hypothetical protein
MNYLNNSNPDNLLIHQENPKIIQIKLLNT